MKRKNKKANKSAIVAHERAARFGLQIPVWRGGAIVFINPELKAQPDAAPNTDKPRV